uniref:glutathione peroxidase n=1 Tax=Eptatretus burgeri TaxID=7764 RepID=A0A8C4QIL7_EPTBU
CHTLLGDRVARLLLLSGFPCDMVSCTGTGGTSLHNFSALTIDGQRVIDLNTLRDRLTFQYIDLNALQTENNDDLTILGFPCNQFGLQEPGKDSEILNGLNSFGDPVNRLFWKPMKVSDIKWNFEKFLIDPNGNPVRRYFSRVHIGDVRKDVILHSHLDQLGMKRGCVSSV